MILWRFAMDWHNLPLLGEMVDLLYCEVWIIFPLKESGEKYTVFNPPIIFYSTPINKHVMTVQRESLLYLLSKRKNDILTSMTKSPQILCCLIYVQLDFHFICTYHDLNRISSCQPCFCEGKKVMFPNSIPRPHPIAIKVQPLPWQI